ncbi:unknown protein [Oryza sativa Japonica Group]|uniref:Uncharacterized protein n=1 Tax=Oryza sativa subsp. japonica TaxID=39947 RepID=Q5ZDT3_ORYSJ|nr:unknown protein [Oryza sativa Japonica Group]BAD52575.1 unknown protein [Oryza sativa Japonica Group]
MFVSPAPCTPTMASHVLASSANGATSCSPSDTTTSNPARSAPRTISSAFTNRRVRARAITRRRGRHGRRGCCSPDAGNGASRGRR